MDAQRVSDPEVITISDDDLDNAMTMALMEGAGESLGTQPTRFHRYTRRASRNSNTPIPSNESSNQEVINYAESDKSDEEGSAKESSLIDENEDRHADTDEVIFIVDCLFNFTIYRSLSFSARRKRPKRRFRLRDTPMEDPRNPG
jgi:hypothetical protein